MKNSAFYLFTFLFLNLNCFAQNDSDINENWKDVKQILIYKTEIVLELTSKLQKSKKIDKSELTKTESNAKELKLVCENKVLDKEAVNKVKQKNGELNTYLVRTLVNLEFDLKMKKNEDVIFICDQLAVAENQILSKINRYNEVCLSSDKKSLIFEMVYQNQSPEVKF